MNVRVVGRGDEEWPEQLEELGGYPVPNKLHVAGLPLRAGPHTIAVVGTRRPSAAGIETALRMATGLAEAGFTIVSGLAVGIDALAHRAALDADGDTIAVLGCGLGVVYPERNASLRRRIISDGTLVTEYPDGTKPTAHAFPQRNRIIAGISRAVLVVEGGERSGALITARVGLDANRSVFAVPGSVRNPMAAGPNELIRKCEATPVTEVGHILDELAPGLVWDGPAQVGIGGSIPQLDDLETEVLSVMDDAPVGPDAICSQLGLAPGRVALALSRLEVRNLIVRRFFGYEISTAGARVRTALCSRSNPAQS